jgi:hypothetical protein
MNIRHKLVFTLLILLSVILLSAVAVSAEEVESYGFGGFSIGSQWLDLSSLNSALSSNGFATFNDPTLSLGFESYFAAKGKYLFGLEFQLFWQEATNANYIQKLNGYWGFVNFGYSVLPRSMSGFHLYPIFGLGVSRNRLRLTERAVLNFTDIVSDPARESFLTKWDFMLQAALGADFTMGFTEAEDGGSGGGFMLGVRAGYQHSVTDSSWNMSNLDVAGSPGMSMSGFYLRFVIGGLGYGEGFDKHEKMDF